MIELFVQPLEIADTVAVGVEERLHVQLVDDRILVPQRVLDAGVLGLRLQVVHALLHYLTRQIENGRPGSRRSRCHFPVQVNL